MPRRNRNLLPLVTITMLSIALVAAVCVYAYPKYAEWERASDLRSSGWEPQKWGVLDKTDHGRPTISRVLQPLVFGIATTFAEAPADAEIDRARRLLNTYPAFAELQRLGSEPVQAWRNDTLPHLTIYTNNEVRVKLVTYGFENDKMLYVATRSEFTPETLSSSAMVMQFQSGANQEIGTEVDFGHLHGLIGRRDTN